VAGALAGEIAIVTGAGRGFGREIALRLAHEGAAVGVISRSWAEIKDVADQIDALGGRAFAAVADVTDRAQVDWAVDEIQGELDGPVSCLVNNAGRDVPFGPIGYVDPDEWWTTHAIHVRGPLLFMSKVLPGMRERHKGHVVNIASLGGQVIEPNMSAYAVGKAAEIRLTQHVGAENKDHGVGVFAIEPGTVITAMGEATLNNPEAKRWIPGGIEFLKAVQAAQRDPAVRQAVFDRCGDMVTGLLSGRYDVLSGRYLEPGDDFDALAAEARAAEAKAAV
jgi:NAD(P)-dependent dehydrogenase (short-subunit alcohol dehydrogenase family)